MKFSKSILALICVCLLGTFVGVIGVGCKPVEEPDVSITLTDSVFRKDLYINKKYTIDNLVEKENGVEYSITECFYFDKDFNKINIETDGQSFTQTVPYDVILTITAKRGSKTAVETLELKINFNTTPILEEFVASWAPTGIIKTYVADPEYLKGDAETAISVRYMGDWNVPYDGVLVGDFSKAYESFSVTDYSNAVMVFDVFNAAPYDIEFGYQMTKDGIEFEGGTGVKLIQVLPAGEWTSITWSLRAMGFTENCFAQNGWIGLRARCNDDTVTAPYDYTLYFCNPDVTDYSAEKFPGLDTRTPEEIKADEQAAKEQAQKEKYESLSGDELDKKTAAYTDGDANFTSTTSLSNIGYDGSTSSIEYTFVNDGKNRGYYANLKSIGNLLLDENSVLYNAYKNDITDWATAYVGFWLKNDSDYPLELAIRFQTAVGEGADKQWQGTVLKYEWYNAKVDASAHSMWKYYEMSLADIAAAADNMYIAHEKGKFHTQNVTDFKLCLAAYFAGAGNVGDTATIYIDGLSIYNKIAGDAEDEMLIRDSKNEQITLQEINRDTAYVKEGNSSAKFTYNNNGWAGEWYYMTKADAQSFNLANWDDVTISFYVYSVDGLGFNFQFYTDTIPTIYSETKVNTANEWTKITCSLKALGLTSVADLHEQGFNFRFRVSANEQKEYVFYIDGFVLECAELPPQVEDLEGDELEKNLIANASGDANIEGTTSTTVVKSDLTNNTSSLQYTFTNNGETYEGQQDGSRTGRIILDVSSVLYNAYKDGITDWSTAYVRFYIKNGSAHAIRIAPRFQTAIGEGSDKQWQGTVLKYEWWQNAVYDIGANADWTLIEVSLADIAAGADNMFGGAKSQFYTENVTDFKFCLALCVPGAGNVDDTATIYIDGLEIVNK